MSNRVREVLDGGVAFGARVRTFSTTVIRAVGLAGLDYAYLDLEHAGFSPYDGIELDRVRTAADAVGIDLVVRLPTGEPPAIRKVLDAGIRTVIVPRVETASDVTRAVKAAYFEYDGEPGERGLGSGPGNNWGVRPEGYTSTEDEAVLVGVMLETESALRNADEILSVPRLGFAKIGTGDLSVSLGHPQEYDHPAVEDAVDAFEETARSHDVPLGTGTSSVTEAREALERGYSLVDIGGDIEVLRSILRERLGALDPDRA